MGKARVKMQPVGSHSEAGHSQTRCFRLVKITEFLFSIQSALHIYRFHICRFNQV